MAIKEPDVYRLTIEHRWLAASFVTVEQCQAVMAYVREMFSAPLNGNVNGYLTLIQSERMDYTSEMWLSDVWRTSSGWPAGDDFGTHLNTRMAQTRLGILQAFPFATGTYEIVFHYTTEPPLPPNAFATQ